MPQNTLKEFDTEASKAISHLKAEFAKLQAGRATPAMAEGVQVDVYGQMQPIKNLANISVPESNQLVIQPWDKSTLQPIEKALNDAEINAGISNDGILIRITVPQPTEERRRDLAKIAKNLAEEARISVRQSRQIAHEAIKEMEKEKSVSEDECRGYQEDLQKKVDDYNHQIEELVKEKENSIMTI